MSTTYNPRDNSPIKMPEATTCITCGQSIAPQVKPLTNTMNRYVNDINGTEVVLNKTEDYIEIQGVQLRRKNVPKVEKITPLPAGGTPKAPAVPIVPKVVVPQAPVVPKVIAPTPMLTPAPIVQQTESTAQTTV